MKETYLVFLEKVILDANKYLDESKKHHSQMDADLARRDEKKAFTLIKEGAETILKNRPQGRSET